MTFLSNEPAAVDLILPTFWSFPGELVPS
jgi:hypothetical protein